jgi:hypothetical protein
MRPTEYLSLVVIIGVFAWISLSAVQELNTSFEDNQINTSLLEGDYNKISTIQDEVNKSIENFKTLGDTDKSWFQKIGAGIVAIPYAVVSFPLLILKSVFILENMMVNSLGGMVASIIILAIITFLFIEIVKRFMEFFQRSRA